MLLGAGSKRCNWIWLPRMCRWDLSSAACVTKDHLEFQHQQLPASLATVAIFPFSSFGRKTKTRKEDITPI